MLINIILQIIKITGVIKSLNIIEKLLCDDIIN